MKRAVALAAAAALLTGCAIAGTAAPALADTPVSTYAELVTAVAAASDTVVLTADIAQVNSTLGVDPGDSVTIDLAGHDLLLIGAASEAGIGVPVTSSLTLMDSVGGKVASVTGGLASAGIGGDVGTSSGTITIQSGHVVAQAGNGGAGVGGGSGAAGGTFVMNGGHLESFGSALGGAGIGGGVSGAGGTITITGGKVGAVGGNGGAGIGGGIDGPGGVIDISGGDVNTGVVITVGSTDSGAAIGGGAHAAGGTTTISGGHVVANSQGILGSGVGGAGIGGGAGALAGTISLLGGHIEASTGVSASGAAIGTGGFALFTIPIATVAGTPNPGAATRSGEGISSHGAIYLANAAAGIGYSATKVDGVDGVSRAEAELTFDYLVTFDPAGGSPDPADQQIVWGSPVIEPTPPTRVGYSFGGWHVGTDAGPLWDFTDPVTGLLDLVASWHTLPSITGAATTNAAVGDAGFSYSPTVGPMDGTITVTVSPSLPAGLSLNATTGQITGPASGPIGGFDVVLTASNGTPAEDDTLALHIDIVAGADQLISFDTAGGSPGPHAILVGLGETVPPEPDPVRPGFVFDDWRVGSAAGPVYDFSTPVTGPLTLVAAWGPLPTLTGPPTASGTDGQAITTVQLVATPPGVTVTDDGTLPTGLAFNPATLQVTGVPTGLAGTYPVTFTASNAFDDATHVVTFTIAHGAATSFTTSASDFTPDQGDTITVTVTASDGYGNTWDAAADATITSNVASDVIVGDQVTFPHASPHTLNVALAGLPAQQLLIQVTARSILGLTGSDGARIALPVGVLAILCGTSLMLLRRRREA